MVEGGFRRAKKYGQKIAEGIKCLRTGESEPELNVERLSDYTREEISGR